MKSFKRGYLDGLKGIQNNTGKSYLNGWQLGNKRYLDKFWWEVLTLYDEEVDFYGEAFNTPDSEHKIEKEYREMDSGGIELSSSQIIWISGMPKLNKRM
jgi:hypothetical protein